MFQLITARKIVFGVGSRHSVADAAAEIGARAVLIRSHSIERSAFLLEALDEREVETIAIEARGEPTLQGIMEMFHRTKAHEPEVVIGFGGGSLIDVAKALAAMYSNGGELTDYLEVVGKGLPLTHPAIPIIAVPTTAGTGSEVTKNAVIDVPQHSVKVSLRDPSMIPHTAVIDAELMCSMPPQVTAATGMDAFVQLMEAYVSNQSNPLIDPLCEAGMRLVMENLERAYHHGDDLAARENMARAALYSGFAVANAKLGAVHGFAGPLGGMIHAPHGMLCATLAPAVMQANVKALESNVHSNTALHRFRQVARIICGSDEPSIEEACEKVRRMLQIFKIPNVKELGFIDTQIPELLEKARKSSSMRGNPVQLSEEEMRWIIAHS